MNVPHKPRRRAGESPGAILKLGLPPVVAGIALRNLDQLIHGEGHAFGIFDQRAVNGRVEFGFAGKNPQVVAGRFSADLWSMGVGANEA